jgi:hypothetical protein
LHGVCQIDSHHCDWRLGVPSQPSIQYCGGLTGMASHFRPADIAELEVKHGGDDKGQSGSHTMDPCTIRLAKQQGANRGRINDGDRHGRGE